MVFQGAERAHRSYEKLIAHYDIPAAASSTCRRADPVAWRSSWRNIAYAVEGLATIPDRATAEAGVAAPEVTLTPATLLATLAVPRKPVVKRLAKAGVERRLVESMYDELAATGARRSEPPRGRARAVRALYEREVAGPRRQQRAGSARSACRSRAARRAHLAGKRQDAGQTTRSRRSPPRAGASPPPPLLCTPAPADAANLAGARRGAEAPRVHLRADDDLEAAPSIGPSSGGASGPPSA